MSTTLVTAWTAARNRLRDAGVETPAFDARLLIEAAASVTRTDILTDPYRELSPAQLSAIEAFVARRELREPVSHILGKKAFWTFELTVTPAVLAPRPETELLVETALSFFEKDAPAEILDLGIGSGAIAIALLHERRRARVTGADKSADALAIARFNAVAQLVADRLTLIESDWAEAIAGETRFDVIVSNPPYVRAGAIDLLEPEVARFEPRLALDGGRDGLDAYRIVMPAIARLLKPDGRWAVEIGQGQAEAVWAHADKAGLRPEGVRHDLAGVDRVVYGRK